MICSCGIQYRNEFMCTCHDAFKSNRNRLHYGLINCKRRGFAVFNTPHLCSEYIKRLTLALALIAAYLVNKLQAENIKRRQDLLKAFAWKMAFNKIGSQRLFAFYGEARTWSIFYIWKMTTHKSNKLFIEIRLFKNKCKIVYKEKSTRSRQLIKKPCPKYFGILSDTLISQIRRSVIH